MRAWKNFGPQLLLNAHHDGDRLPMLRRHSRLSQHLPKLAGKMLQELFGKPASKSGRVSQDAQIVTEFRSKLRLAEDLISKLAFSLREIQVQRKKDQSGFERAGTNRGAASGFSAGMAKIVGVIRPDSAKR